MEGAASHSKSGLRARVGRGAAWSTLDAIVGRTGNFALGLVVARLLDPRDFGIYAIALVVHQIVFSMSDLGLGSALAREDEQGSKAAAPTVATLTLISSALLGAIMAFFAPQFARWLGDVHAASTMRVMALSVPLAGLTAVPVGMLRREFRIEIKFVADVTNLMASAVVVILLASAGAGPLALAWSFVAGWVMSVIVFIFGTRAWYWPGWDRRRSWQLLRFGLPLTGATMLQFAIQNVDYVAVGAIVGATPLGYYVLAFNMAGWPENLISQVINSVSVAAFSRLRAMGSDMGKVIAQTVGGAARITLPVCFFMGALAHPLVVLVYGSKWERAASVLITLSIMGAARTLISVFNDYLISAGRTTALLISQVVWLPSLAVALVFAVHSDGIAGAGFAQAGISWLVVVPVFVYLAHLDGVRAAPVVCAVAPTFCWAAACAALAWLISTRFSSPLFACAAGGAGGLAVYLIPHAAEIRRQLEKLLAKRRAAASASHSASVPEGRT
ncbi:MAG: lipopolysaccharide biosynthesis protein, partial [Conexibacteraceae bacterium]|nr:lipopolysaccharide biosynthesis protein [Conexibacteraceae bacterium]